MNFLPALYADQLHIHNLLAQSTTHGKTTDGHARNHSFLIEGDVLTFAPIYDVAPTMAFVDSRTTALAIAGESQIAKVTRL